MGSSNHPFSLIFIFSNSACFKFSRFRNFPFIIIFSSNHTIFELWGFFCPWNPSRFGTPKTTNAPIAWGQNARTSLTSHFLGVAIVGGVVGAFPFFLLATIVVFCIQQSPSQMQQSSVCTFLWSHLAFGFFHIYLIAERHVCTCIKFVFGNMLDWAREKLELWMEKLFIWERCRWKGREGTNDVVFLCSFSL